MAVFLAEVTDDLNPDSGSTAALEPRLAGPGDLTGHAPGLVCGWGHIHGLVLVLKDIEKNHLHKTVAPELSFSHRLISQTGGCTQGCTPGDLTTFPTVTVEKALPQWTCSALN